jgi:hypothetical protein
VKKKLIKTSKNVIFIGEDMGKEIEEKEKIDIKEVKDYRTEDFRKFEERVSKLNERDKETINTKFELLQEKISSGINSAVSSLLSAWESWWEFEKRINNQEFESLWGFEERINNQEFEERINRFQEFKKRLNNFQERYKKALEENGPKEVKEIKIEAYEIILKAAKFIEEGEFLSESPVIKINIELIATKVRILQLKALITARHYINEMWDLCDKRDYKKFEEKLEEYKKLQEKAKEEDNDWLDLFYQTIIEAAEIYRSHYQKFPNEIRG